MRVPWRRAVERVKVAFSGIQSLATSNSSRSLSKDISCCACHVTFARERLPQAGELFRTRAKPFTVKPQMEPQREGAGQESTKTLNPKDLNAAPRRRSW